MKIAVTYENGNVFQHFGHTEEFKIYTIKEGVVVNSEVIGSNGNGHELLANYLSEGNVDILICGGIGGGAINALSSLGIKVVPGASGAADIAVDAFLKGQLVVNPTPNCNHHGEGHTCGEHSCH